jgi:phosphatidylinositol-3-phosphatase
MDAHREGPGFWPLIGALACLGLVPADAGARAHAPLVRYQHVFVIVEENKDFELIIDPKVAPNIARLARTYGVATAFYGEVHPSEANYVALLGGDTLGIHDDDPFYCKPGSTEPLCAGAARPGYVDHTSDAPHLGDQLRARGLSWKAYLESLPEPGSLAVNAADPKYGNAPPMNLVYASKHAGFVNFKSVQTDPGRAERLVGFDQLEADIRSGKLPNFGLIVPNQCNEMHGLYGVGVVADCDITKPLLTVTRGDRVIGELVAKLMGTRAWRSKDGMAIVITFDESGSGKREGCCAATPDAASNFGGGHIITVVATNHGPRGVADPTPYNHYSLLRTFEDVFGIDQRLGHAADTDKGVVSMTDLFARSKAVSTKAN